MNSIATAIAVLVCSSCGSLRTAVRANLADRVYYGSHHAGDHLYGGVGHGPQYRKINLIGGGGGSGPVALASISSAASVAVPHHHRAPLSANYVEIKPKSSSYYSRSGGPGHGLVAATGNHGYRGCGGGGGGAGSDKGWSSVALRHNELRDKLFLRTSQKYGCDGADEGRAQRHQLVVVPTCHRSCGGHCC